MKLSNSRLDTLKRCSRYFKLAYLDGLETVQGTPALIGNVVHDIVENVLRRNQMAGLDGDILFTEEETRRQIVRLPDDSRHEVTEMMDFWAENFRIPPDHIGGIEMELAIDWDGNAIELEGQSIRDVEGFRGKLDLVEIYKNSGSIKAIITDWKSGWVPPSVDSLETDHQLYRYGLLLLQAFPHVDEIQVKLEFLRLKRTYPPKHKPLMLDLDILRRETWQNILDQKANIQQRIALDKWEPTAGMQCAFCQFECPIKNSPADPKIPTTEEDAKLLAGEIVAYESAIAQREMALHRYLEVVNPRLQAADRFWSVESTENHIYDWGKLHSVAKDLGLDPDALLRPPTDGEIDKYLAKKENAELKKQLGEPLVKYGNPRFDGRKRKPATWPKEGA